MLQKFATPEGLDQISLSIWLLSMRIQEGNTTREEIKREISSSKDYGLRFPKDSLSTSAQPSLISVAQKVVDISRGFFNYVDDYDVSNNIIANDVRSSGKGQKQGQKQGQFISDRNVCNVIPLTQRWLLLIRVVIKSSIVLKKVTDESTNCMITTTEGTLSVSSAKLIKDLLALLDSGFTFLSQGQSPPLPTSRREPLGNPLGKSTENISDLSTSKEGFEPAAVISDDSLFNDRKSAFILLKKLYMELYSTIPEHLLILCRNLNPTAFALLFNTEVFLSFHKF